jgi:hypothetical protein
MRDFWTPITVLVPKELRSRCGVFGYDLVQHIKANRMDGRKIKKDWLDPRFQGLSKVCEVAGAMSCNALDQVDWDYTRVDPGWDFKRGGLRVDVKGTWSRNARYLIYPCDKTQEFDRHDVDVLMMVWTATEKDKNFGYCEVRGWSLKDEYRINKHIVTKGDWDRYRMTAGTWALSQAYLLPVEILLKREWRDAAHIRGEIFGGTASSSEAGDADRGDGKVEGRLGEQTVSGGMRSAGNGRVSA